MKKTEDILPNTGLGSFEKLFPEKTYLNTENEVGKKYSKIINLDFIPQSSYNVLSDASRTISRSRDFFARLNKLKETSRKNYESIPEDATIRREYIKCGNHSCRRRNYGPYYYAYWRAQGKRYKKYVGKYDPRNKES